MKAAALTILTSYIDLKTFKCILWLSGVLGTYFSRAGLKISGARCRVRILPPQGEARFVCSLPIMNCFGWGVYGEIVSYHKPLVPASMWDFAHWPDV